MHLAEIALLNFKNYEEARLDFSPEINCFVGDNGSGKTNLLDAIYYLCLTKSAFQLTEANNVKHDEPYFLLKGQFLRDDKEEKIQVGFQLGQRKQMKRNDVPYERLSEHIGRYPLVLIAPDDTALIKEGNELRRRFFDGLLAQDSNEYLDVLLKYNQLLKQRNSLLKQFAERGRRDLDLLDTYTQQMAPLAEILTQARKQLTEEIEPILQKHYQHLSGGREVIGLTYEADLVQTSATDAYQEARNRDFAAQRTTRGPQRDGYLFTIDGHPAKAFGSQGQQKSLVIALKLAEFELLCQHTGVKPLLLLDDIFDKLDDQRMAHLMELVSGHTFGQLFVTDARPERTAKLFGDLQDVEVRYFKVSKGIISKGL